MKSLTDALEKIIDRSEFARPDDIYIKERNQLTQAIAEYLKKNLILDEKLLSEIIQDTKYVGMVKHYNLKKEWADSIAQAITQSKDIIKLKGE